METVRRLQHHRCLVRFNICIAEVTHVGHINFLYLFHEAPLLFQRLLVESVQIETWASFLAKNRLLDGKGWFNDQARILVNVHEIGLFNWLRDNWSWLWLDRRLLLSRNSNDPVEFHRKDGQQVFHVQCGYLLLAFIGRLQDSFVVAAQDLVNLAVLLS